MAHMSTATVRCAPFAACPAGSRGGSRRAAPVRAAAAPERAPEPSRRDALVAGLAASALLLPQRPAHAEEGLPEGKTRLAVKNLNSFQRKAEREYFQKMAEAEVKAEVTAADAADTLRLVLHDAGTWDVATGTGGLNGSIVLDEELNRPENRSLKGIVGKLKKVKQAIDAKAGAAGYQPISWADLEVLSAKVANEAAWRDVKRARGTPSSGDVISSAFGAAWPVKLGRVDSGKPDPAGRLPPPDASVAQVTDFFARLDNRNYGATGFFAPRPIYDERQAFVLWAGAQPDSEAAEQALAAEPNTSYKGLKVKYDRSRATVTRTDYEVDFIDYVTQLSNLGAKFDPDAYLVPIVVDTPKF